ncbi:MAG: 2,4-dienoyl-CoA reductase [Planctomycetota bacterium]
MPLLESVKIGARTAPNRIAINAMECCDADTEGNPTAATYRRYERVFNGQAGVVVVEALSVIDESRGRLHQLTALPQNRPALARFVSEMKAIGGKSIMLWQLTHSGELSHPEFSKRVCVKPLPGYEGELLTEEQVDYILDQFVLAAKLAHDCGADGVDFKLCHGYFCSQLLRPYNDRKWKYGGSWGNRTRFVYEAYERIDREVNDPKFLVGSKISVWEGIPGGMGTMAPDSPIIDLTEVLDLVKGLEARGAKFIIESAGNPSITLALTQPDRAIPDYAYLHFGFQKALRQTLRPETTVIGSAYSIFRNGKNAFRGVRREEASLTYWGNKNVRDGVCDMIAIGRQSLADPLLPLKLSENRADEVDWCTACDQCIEFLIRQRPVGCPTYDRDFALALREIREQEGRLKEKHT